MYHSSSVIYLRAFYMFELYPLVFRLVVVLKVEKEYQSAHWPVEPENE